MHPASWQCDVAPRVTGSCASPGCDVAGEPNPAALLLLNAVYVVGLLSFAVLIGLLGDDIRGAVEAARL